jgi:cephalosporin hydroxylase
MTGELSYCPALDQLYRTRFAIGRSGNEFRLTSGLSTRNNLRAIRRLMLETRPRRTLEIGMACGGSTLAFAATHREIQKTAGVCHTAIDAFQQTGFDDVGRLKLAEANLQPYVEVIEELSSRALPKLATAGLQFDMIYVDGSHRFEDVFVDFYYCRELLTVNGYLLFDDSSDRDVAKVIRFALRNSGAAFTRVSGARFRMDSKIQRLMYSVGRLVNKTQLEVLQKVGSKFREPHVLLKRF